MKSFFSLLMFVFLFLVSYMVMTVGWGLEVKNWPVVIVGFVLIAFIGAIGSLIND